MLDGLWQWMALRPLLRRVRLRVPVVADLFRDEPQQWALRGDPWLWRDMRARFELVPLPATADELATMVQSAFEELTGSPLSADHSLVVENYKHGGMSSGGIVPEFWRDRAIPLLLRRFEQARG